MKKLFATAVAAVMICSAIMTTAPAKASESTAPIVMEFPLVSFESETASWIITGSSFNSEFSTTTGVIDGTKALKISLSDRSLDWNIINNLSIIPQNQIWTIPPGKAMVASVTNPLDQAIQIRCNLTDIHGNTRMTFFAIEPNSTREIVWDADIIGTPGVKTGKWADDGYSQPGVDTAAGLVALDFYMAEPEVENVMPGLDTPTYIIDNITIKDIS
ncbi:hypothetical protein [Candidatus Epulonipiscium viviparus]|uniref:hypothetical protein n=1 Tax=Candidatus Epulonipiscium viviparus TaxID=420336 RepID=UPI0027380D07|nr:hypothetical protein [Candidatus Epulopiscium viviparus]